MDEPREESGHSLKLPLWLERHRAEIEGVMTPLRVPAWPVTGPDKEQLEQR